jgi:hypothetical protein
MGLLSLIVKLHKAQMKDVEEMQQIYVEAAEIGADDACRKVLGGSYSLSADVKEGVEAHARNNHR